MNPPLNPQFDDADVDLQRQARCGFPEVIFGEGKSPEVVVSILAQQHSAGQTGFVTRVSVRQAETVRNAFPQTIYNPVARTLRIPPLLNDGLSPLNSESPQEIAANLSEQPIHSQIFVAVVTAGTSDRPVAEEAMETLIWMQIACEPFPACGVAGPHRLLRHVPRLKQATAIVCVAGMEAALPSVLGGQVGCPVIGVPTSVGYGASLNGMTSLLSKLRCCSSNGVSVNNDSGSRWRAVCGLIAGRTGAALARNRSGSSS